MGHCIDYISVDKRNSIMKEAEEFAYYNVDRCENPHGTYHGNLTIHDTPICETYEDAVKKIESWDTGWYSDHAVQYKDKDALKPTKAMEVLLERANKLKKDKEEYVKTHSLESRKSEYIGCKVCGSKLSNKYLKGNKCPVCHAELRADYIVDRIKKYDKDYNETLNQYEELKKKQTGKCPIKWLVKVEVHC